MKQSLQLKTSQQLKLTPQLQQSLRLLQLTSVELAAEVQSELEQNPLLEEDDASLSESPPNQEDQSDSTEALTNSDDHREDLNFNSDEITQPSLGADWDESFEDRRSLADEAPYSGDSAFAENLAQAETSLYDHLYWQVSMTMLSERDLLIARAVLRSLDDDGYLTLDPAELITSFAADLDVEVDEIFAVLSLIKSLDPIGVGARNLSERLSAILDHQLSSHEAFPLAKQIVDNHLELLAKKKLPQIKSALGVNDAELAKAIRLITSISPRISSNFGTIHENQVVPDVIVKQINGTWVAAINPVNQHRLKLNKEYQVLLKQKIDAQSADFIRAKHQQAKAFIKGIMSRYDTLLLVAQQILSKQKAFFDHGKLHLVGMTLSDIAGELDMHESTISRATSGKYLQSPAGVFELKYFFSSTLTSNSNDGSATVSSTVIRTLIQRWIDQEDKRKPLSDSKLEALLLAQGHKVARRTVAKYRESLSILSSSQRKSF